MAVECPGELPSSTAGTAIIAIFEWGSPGASTHVASMSRRTLRAVRRLPGCFKCLSVRLARSRGLMRISDYGTPIRSKYGALSRELELIGCKCAGYFGRRRRKRTLQQELEGYRSIRAVRRSGLHTIDPHEANDAPHRAVADYLAIFTASSEAGSLPL